MRVTTQGLKKYLKLSLMTIIRLRQKGIIPFEKINKRYYHDTEKVLEALQKTYTK